jgi:ankyrin repeat protein
VDVGAKLKELVTPGNGEVQLFVGQNHGKPSMSKIDLSPAAKMAYAIREGDVSLVRAILKSGFDLEQEVDGAIGCAALSLAGQYHMDEILAVLIERGASLDAVDREGNTALHHAARDSSREVFEMLLRAGASTNVHSEAAKTPLHLALALGSLSGCGPEALARVRLLLKAGADPDYVPALADTEALSTYLTPLQAAFKRHHVESAIELASVARSSPDQMTANGVTLEQLARGSDALMALLRSMRATHGIDNTFVRSEAEEGLRPAVRANAGPVPL